jgi:hypothetical protein
MALIWAADQVIVTVTQMHDMALPDMYVFLMTKACVRNEINKEFPAQSQGPHFLHCVRYTQCSLHVSRK